ncbi:MAG: PHB depolymerase family esterase [Actinobacteria bacterium]|nr:PHB depolymerase family esterase [Actinomycetota bacterium]
MLRRMREATSLTRAGRLHDATALIQRTLRGAETDASQRQPADGPDPAAPERAVGAAPVRVPSAVVETRRTTDRADSSAHRGANRAAATRGRFISGSSTTGAGTRPYKVYVPAAPTGTAVPLLVLLHGCTQDADDFAAGTRMNALADRHGFVVVYPEQTRQANPSRCWNWFEAADQRRDRGEPSIIADIVRTVIGSTPIDRRRIHVVGMSAGGAMAAVMGHTYPDLFSAVGVHSGLAHGAATDLSSALRAMRHGGGTPRVAGRGIPAIVFHGDRDQTVHRSNAEQVLRQATAHVPHPLLTVHEGAGGGAHDATRYVYRSPDGSTLAEGWAVHGLGHAWSGGDPAGSHTDPHGPDASVEMLRFFSQHARHRA